MSQFRFGVFAGPNFNQVNGDNLSGFNHIGFSAGLLGGYKLKGDNSLIVDLGFNVFGGNRKSEKVPDSVHKILLETNIQTINILLGYQYAFGNRWDGKKFYALNIGVNYHRIVKLSNFILTKNFSIQDKSIADKNFNAQYLALHFSFSRALSGRFKIHLGVDFGLGSLLSSSQYNLSKIAPYSVFSQISYYIF